MRRPICACSRRQRFLTDEHPWYVPGKVARVTSRIYVWQLYFFYSCTRQQCHGRLGSKRMSNSRNKSACLGSRRRSWQSLALFDVAVSSPWRRPRRRRVAAARSCRRYIYRFLECALPGLADYAHKLAFPSARLFLWNSLVSSRRMDSSLKKKTSFDLLKYPLTQEFRSVLILEPVRFALSRQRFYK